MNDFSGTKSISEENTFSSNHFLDWAKEYLPNIDPQLPLQVSQFKGGQSNPTFLLKHNDSSFVLRRKPSGKLLPSAHAIDCSTAWILL